MESPLKKHKPKRPHPVFCTFDVLENIFKFLDLDQLKDCRRVSKVWNEAACRRLRRSLLLRLSIETAYKLLAEGQVQFGTVGLARPFEDVHLNWNLSSSRHNCLFPYVSSLNSSSTTVCFRSIVINWIQSVESREQLYKDLIIPHTQSLVVLRLFGEFNVSQGIQALAAKLVFPNLRDLEINAKAGSERRLDESSGEHDLDIVDTASFFLDAAPVLQDLYLCFWSRYFDKILVLDKRLQTEGWVRLSLTATNVSSYYEITRKFWKRAA